jgi:hypothetical protein
MSPGIDILHELGNRALSGSKNLADVRTLQTFDHKEPLLPLGDALATGSTVRCQHQQDIVDPPSIIKLFQEHPSDIPLVDTVEVIRMQEAVTLLIRPGMHVVALAQKHPGEHGEACRVQHGF